MPSFVALLRNEASVRFVSLAILDTGVLALECARSSLTSAFVYSRRTVLLSFLATTTLLTEGLLARTVRLATDPWYCRHPRLHEARHSKIRWPFSSTTNTRFDRQNSPAFLNSAARNLACCIASSGVERLFPTSSGKTFGPSKI